MTKPFYSFLCATYHNPWIAVLGVTVGAGTMWVKDIRNEAAVAQALARDRPVVAIKSTLVQVDSFGVILKVGPGEKLRECEYLGIQGFIRMPSGFLREVPVKRIDVPETGQTKPVGKFADFGEWRLSTRMVGATRAYLYVNHDCNGYTKASMIGDVCIKDQPEGLPCD